MVFNFVYWLVVISGALNIVLLVIGGCAYTIGWTMTALDRVKPVVIDNAAVDPTMTYGKLLPIGTIAANPRNGSTLVYMGDDRWFDGEVSTKLFHGYHVVSLPTKEDEMLWRQTFGLTPVYNTNEAPKSENH